MKDFKVLFLYSNGKLMNPPPISIGIFTALLKEHGFDVDLFDTTLYDDPDKIGSDEAKEESLMVRPFDYGERRVELKKSNMGDDFVRKVEEYQPDLIAVSVLESTYPTAVSLMKVIEGLNIPIIVGGVFATFAAEIVFSNKNVEMVCIGEGEEVLVEVCKRMSEKKDCSDVKNICVKKDGKIIRNGMRALIDINNLPIADYSLFEQERFFRPMAGKVYKTIPIETDRGCPYACTFCNSPSTAKLYKENNSSTFFRKKTMSRIQQELKYLVKKWDAEYIYFTSDTFLSINDDEFEKFVEIYSEFKIPFWLQSRAETITEHRARKLKESGCHRISIGLEHGNNEFRKKVLKKKFDNEQMIRASKILADAGIPLTINNMIGFPDETRELIFDTIELNRKLSYDTTAAFPFAPFHGTALQQLCVERGYITEDFNPGSLNVDASLDMPQLSREEVKGLRRTFALYAKMPKEDWPKIRRAEKFDDEGNRIFAELKKDYQEKYFDKNKA
jgi:anaerobic magnesium-protoporphyrin IX monomethyl ester cyclase